MTLAGSKLDSSEVYYYGKNLSTCIAFMLVLRKDFREIILTYAKQHIFARCCSCLVHIFAKLFAGEKYFLEIFAKQTYLRKFL